MPRVTATRPVWPLADRILRTGLGVCGRSERRRDHEHADTQELPSPFGEMVDWLEGPWTTLRPVAGHPMRVEDHIKDAASTDPRAATAPAASTRPAMIVAFAARTVHLRGMAARVTIEKGVVRVGADLMTGRPGIFAGGDMVPAERTVTVAIGHGKKAARSIHAWLTRDQGGNGHAAASGGGLASETAPRLATTDRLNTWYYSDAPATIRPKLEAARRITTFDEVTGGVDESTAQFEARRCVSCGNCFECDNCYGVCPDNAVVKLGPGRRYEIDLDYCKGCGICAAECPCGAIDMVPERI